MTTKVKVRFKRGNIHEVTDGYLSVDPSGDDKGIYLGDGENAVKVAGTPTKEEITSACGDTYVSTTSVITEKDVNEICK